MKRSVGLCLPASTIAALLVVMVPLAAANDVELGVRTEAAQGDAGSVAAIAPGVPIRVHSDAAPAHVESPVAEVSAAPGESAGQPHAMTGQLRIPAPGEVVASHAARTAAGLAVGLGILVYFWNTIQWMLGGLAMPFFSRIDGHRILDNDVRSRVHEAILQNPGITIKEVTTVLGIGWGTAIYHLKRLETERLVVSERHRQYRRFFKNGGGIVNDAKAAFSELKNPTTQRLAQELVHRPGAAQKDLCQALGISAPLAHKYLARLEDARLLTKAREWKTVKYFPTPRLSEMLANPAPRLAAVA